MAKFFFCDVETLGLNEKQHPMIQVAGIMYAPNFVELGRTEDLYIHPNQYGKCEWSSQAAQMHRESGLLDRAIKFGRPIYVVEEELINFVKSFEEVGDVIYLAGNSVHFDARFLKENMPVLFNKFHYRMLDITAVRLYIHFMFGEDINFAKKKCHTSLADLEETLAEAKYYKEFFEGLGKR